ncbi:MAG TPA: beta-ketoacyl-[acyl-carrier-protein] synthase family protein [Tissierellales bacterium]|nr:beta-ketoacyl-[acyl-carrier-protein] synthase family protein [Tissierellales bacterium]
MANDVRVVITGMGMISSLGYNLKENWNNLCEGKNGIKNISSFDTSKLDTKFAAEVDSSIVDEKVKELFIRREYKQMTKNTRMGVISTCEAIEASGLDKVDMDMTRVAVIMGVVSTNNNSMNPKPKSNFIVKTMPNAISAWTTIKYGFEGPNFNVSSACASSAYAIVLGQYLIRSGLVDVAIVGGADASVEEQYIQGFNQILALSTRNEEPETACRPFCVSRDGFVMGEGAGTLVLENYEFAKNRDAKIYGQLLGSAFTSEAGDITAPKKDGVGMAETMEIAMKDAGICYDSVDYINAHGTSTYLNDKYETMAIKSLFKDRQSKINISSTKSMLGHTIAACSAIEGIVTVMSLKNGVITPTINHIDPDEELDLNYTPNVKVFRNINIALSNSFGFGGHNGCLILKKY